MENRGFRPSIQRRPERQPQSPHLEDDISMKSGDDELGGDYENGSGKPIWDVSRIHEPEGPKGDENSDEDGDSDEDDDAEPDYDRDIKPYQRIPVQEDGHVEPPPSANDIPYDPEQDAEWQRKRENPDDPDSVPRGVWKMEDK